MPGPRLGLGGTGSRGTGPRHEVVETGEQFVRREVERRQRRDGGAHPAHGGGRARAVSGDVPHHQPDACPGEGDDVVPVPADAGGPGRGQIAVGDLHARLLGQGAREKITLEHERGRVFSGVAAGVVQADRGAGDELFGELDLLMLEGVGVSGACEGRHAQGGAAGLEGKGEHVGGRVGGRRVLGQAPQADGVQCVVRGVLGRGVIGAVSHPAQGGVGAEVLWFLPAQDGFDDVHGDGVGELGDHEFRQFSGPCAGCPGSFRYCRSPG